MRCHILADPAWEDKDPLSVLSLTQAFPGAASALLVDFLPYPTSGGNGATCS